MTSTYYQLTDIIAGSFTSATDITQNQGIVDALLAAHPSSNLILNTPPVTPSAGDLYIIGPAPTGIWAGLADAIAIYTVNGYFYIPASIGCRVNVNDGSTYIFGGGGWALVSGGGGSGGTTKFRSNYSSTTTDADPTATNFRLDNATIASATFINISNDAINSLDISSTLGNLKAGNQIYLENTGNQSEYLLATITTIVDNTTYYKLNITIDDSSGPTWTDTEEFEWVFMYPDTIGGGSGSSIQFEFEYSNGVTATNPGSGLFKLNNTTIASATRLFIHRETQVGANIASILSLSTTSTRFYLENTSDPTQYLVLSIDSFVNNTLWYDFAITVEDSSGPTWTDTDVFGLTIAGSGGGRNITAFQLNYQDTITDTDPGSENFQLDNLTIGSATFMNISDDALNSLDISSPVANLKAGNQFYLENIDLDTEYLLVTVTSVVDNTTYHKVNLTVDDSSGGTWSDNTTFEFRFMYPDTPGGGSGDVVPVVWDFNSSTGIGDPGTGRFSLDNVNPSLSNTLLINDNLDAGADYTEVLSSLNIGDLIYIQNVSTNTEYLLVSIDSITDSTTYFNLSITVEDGTTSAWTNTDNFSFTFYLKGSGGALPTTTKGDIIVHNGTTDVRLPVGTNGQLIRADSTTTEGIEWFTFLNRQAAETGNFSLVDADDLTLIPVDTTSGDVTVTLPDGLATNLRVVLVNIGTNSMILSAATTLNSTDDTVYFQWVAVEVTHTGSNVWEAFGGLGPDRLSSLNDSILNSNENLTITDATVQVRDCTVASNLVYPSLASKYEGLIREGRNIGAQTITVQNHDATTIQAVATNGYWKVVYDGTDWILLNYNV